VPAGRIGCWCSGSDSLDHISVSIFSALAEGARGDSNVEKGRGLTLQLRGAFEKDEDVEKGRAWKDYKAGSRIVNLYCEASIDDDSGCWVATRRESRFRRAAECGNRGGELRF
jgi:hypothetical protein